jgi:radical SAM superfamily enzyme YgiQ (UPF0313 family)
MALGLESDVLLIRKALSSNKYYPERLAEVLRSELGATDVVVAGAQEDRIVIIGDYNPNSLFVSSSLPLADHPLVTHCQTGIDLANPGSQVSMGRISLSALAKLTTPHMRLIALYHAEQFPLPRFPLGISDIAAAVRKQFIGRVSLQDMQFGLTADGIIASLDLDRPEIVGISATFGQYDLLEHVLTRLPTIHDYDPLVVIGGSLPALIADLLVRRFPRVLVSKGPGEQTMKDVMKFWHNELPISAISDIVYLKSGFPFRTPRRPAERDVEFPELDLLDETLKHRGVMQLESSRGCTYHCSFCPRDQKGLWLGGDSAALEQILSSLAHIYESYPRTARKVFLVDEEFIGYRDGALIRAASLAGLIHKFGFVFESSTRVDQVYRPSQSLSWHEERILFWRSLAVSNLSRMLFGVESGVDTVLERFNKKATSSQNVLAVRLLTACDVPLRLTYITFDPLMSLAELLATYRFLGRTDILFNPLPSLSPAELFAVVNDPSGALGVVRGEPLYREISYMLVSMECLMGSPYLQMVERAGLAGDINLSMGRRNASYADPQIGILSEASQKWIDRNFALEYFLKSLEKIRTRPEVEPIRGIRKLLRDASYSLLGRMLALVTGDLGVLNGELARSHLAATATLRSAWEHSRDDLARAEIVELLLEDHLQGLQARITPALSTVQRGLDLAENQTLDRLLTFWTSQHQWRLINE